MTNGWGRRTRSVKLGCIVAWFMVVNLFYLRASAYMAGEKGSGIIELRSNYQTGLIVNSFAVRKKSKKLWAYFCIGEARIKNRERCFYGPARQVPDLRPGARLQSVEYALLPRIYNRQGHIPIGPRRYFYPIRKTQF